MAFGNGNDVFIGLIAKIEDVALAYEAVADEADVGFFVGGGGQAR